MINYRVQDYTDYRSFLNAVFLKEKAASNSKLSKKVFAQKLGLSDSNFRMICKGQRNLTPKNAITISQNLKFSKNDAEYFINLVCISNLKSPDSKQIVNEQLISFNLKSGSKQLNTSYQDFILDSNLQAVIVFIKDMNLNIENDDINSIVSKKFKFTLTETKRIIQKICELKISLNNNQGFHIIYSKLSNNISRNEYLKNEFLIASQYVKNSETSKSLFSAKTFSIPKNKISDFAMEYKKLTEKYMNFSDDNKENLEVIRVLFHVRPITKI